MVNYRATSSCSFHQICFSLESNRQSTWVMQWQFGARFRQHKQRHALSAVCLLVVRYSGLSRPLFFQAQSWLCLLGILELNSLIELHDTLDQLCFCQNTFNNLNRFYAGSFVANMFGGLLAAGVLGNLEGAHGTSGWRWLFIIEGVITVGIALTATQVLFHSRSLKLILILRSFLPHYRQNSRIQQNRYTLAHCTSLVSYFLGLTYCYICIRQDRG
jgi:hypothetical protein